MNNIRYLEIISKTLESLRKIWGLITNLGSFMVKFINERKVCKSYIKMKLLVSASQKSWCQGHQRSPRQKSPKMVQFSVFFNNRQIIPQNEAFTVIFSEELVSRLFDVIQGQPW